MQDQNSPSFVDEAKSSVTKSLPGLVGKFINTCFHGTFIVVRELGRIIREALGQ